MSKTLSIKIDDCEMKFDIPEETAYSFLNRFGDFDDPYGWKELFEPEFIQIAIESIITSQLCPPVGAKEPSQRQKDDAYAIGKAMNRAVPKEVYRTQKMCMAYFKKYRTKAGREIVHDMTQQMEEGRVFYKILGFFDLDKIESKVHTLEDGLLGVNQVVHLKFHPKSGSGIEEMADIGPCYYVPEREAFVYDLNCFNDDDYLSGWVYPNDIVNKYTIGWQAYEKRTPQIHK